VIRRPRRNLAVNEVGFKPAFERLLSRMRQILVGFGERLTARTIGELGEQVFWRERERRCEKDDAANLAAIVLDKKGRRVSVRMTAPPMIFVGRAGFEAPWGSVVVWNS
jgi:hypothetical protein